MMSAGSPRSASNRENASNGEVVSTNGSWEAGVDGAKPGVIMHAEPKVGQSYYQEYYPGEAIAWVAGSLAIGLGAGILVIKPRAAGWP